jgi:hypothetical protein
MRIFFAYFFQMTFAYNLINGNSLFDAIWIESNNLTILSYTYLHTPPQTHNKKMHIQTSRWGDDYLLIMHNMIIEDARDENLYDQ